jgi:hypothetical protein
LRQQDKQIASSLSFQEWTTFSQESLEPTGTEGPVTNKLDEMNFLIPSFFYADKTGQTSTKGP